MAASFINLPIRITLNDGRVCQGKLESIDQGQGILALDNVTLQLPSGRSTHLSAHLVKRDDIKAVEVLAVEPNEQENKTQVPQVSPVAIPDDPAAIVLNAPTPTQLRPNTSLSTARDDLSDESTPRRAAGNSSGGKSSTKRRNPKQRRSTPKATPVKVFQDSEADESGQPLDDEFVPTNSEAETAITIAPSKHLLPPQPTKRKSTSSRGKNRSNSNSVQAVHQYHPNSEIEASTGAVSFDEDFDFARGLQSFDKKRVFQEIRDADDTDPATLLVSHNKKSDVDHRYTTKLGINENVLDDSEADAPRPISIIRKGSSRTALPEKPREPENGDKVIQSISDVDEDARDDDFGMDQTIMLNRRFASAQGLACPLLDSKSWKEIIQVANIESGPNLIQRIENGARGIAQYTLRGAFLSKQKQTSSCVILCGQSLKAQFGLRAGAHLVNKGVTVTAWLAPGDSLSASLEFQLRLFSAAGGKVVRAISDLPSSPEVIFDCLLDNESDPKSKRKSTVIEGEAAFYANANASPTICFDLPSGIDVDSGQSTGSWSIVPQCIIGLGSMKSGLGILDVPPKLAIVDLGLPQAAYERGFSKWPRTLLRQDWIVSVKVI